MLLLLVIVHCLVKTNFEQDCWVGEVSHRVGSLLGAEVLSAAFLSLVLVLLLELFLEVEYAVLEVEFVHVVFGLERENLILRLLRKPIASLGQPVQLLDAINFDTDLLVQAAVNLVLNHLLLAGGVDLLLELLVLAFDLVKGVQALVQLVFAELYLVGISFNHDLLDLVLVDVLVNFILLTGGQSSLGKVPRSRLHIKTVEWDTEFFTHSRVIDIKHAFCFLFFKLLLRSFDLTCQDHKALLLMLELLREAVSFALQALRLALIHGCLAQA